MVHNPLHRHNPVLQFVDPLRQIPDDFGEQIVPPRPDGNTDGEESDDELAVKVHQITSNPV